MTRSLAMYKDELKLDGLVMDNVNDQKWSLEAFTQALDTCDNTPVFFTNTMKTTNPAWIVSAKERNGWRMDLVRSIDEEEQSVVYTLEDIISKVLPDYPDLVHVKAPVAAEN
ncbi:hypothetical protein QFC22_002477 [Naganishia vaughanmartiniae]|uniref:Uncharacterized protein n=1 Tax=Naganishia vaughanmartiniae TaxID=1424756 RepID=A0ACC2XCS0_9TREE|nr:hypothetical protein QFC22_002477 [Naganishia vaughanmartiniae]